jgi:hypothetical protein
MGLLLSLYHNSAPVNKKFWQALSGNFSDSPGSDYSFNCAAMRGSADSSIPKFDLTVPWPESDRLEGHLWATISGMITIAKVHFWDTGSDCFNPPVEEGSGEGSPDLQNLP